MGAVPVGHMAPYGGMALLHEVLVARAGAARPRLYLPALILAVPLRSYAILGG